MRLAVTSDIHGNLLALQAVVADLQALSVDAVVNLGDCASGPLWPGETVEMLRGLGWPTVRGNHDRTVGRSADGSLGRSDSFAWSNLTRDQRRWLAELPSSLSVAGALCVHGGIASDDDFLTDEICDGRLAPSAASAIESRLTGETAEIVLCGHSHLQGGYQTPTGKTVLNPGSVGWPAYRSASQRYVLESGSPHARYAVIEIEEAPPRMELRAVEYNWRAASARALRNGRPDWSHWLITGTVV
ncbi:metallophosphoesterase family protein [Chelatococcus sambhunathii]|uniref:Metallophosphoesterase family protein n=1 Tax=Chelatococcus sambhunathii TaxID=363953 RepID=A0ABU1DAD5_9HYPH|nr:metallophosphoesterase family protein [Chelatococcus sambhunathii]MDR4305042.1 metallophosphoesterase family protein [Chelatococcus sambhunathii]